MSAANAELVFDGHRIYASAFPCASAAGFIAAVVVVRLGENGLPSEIVFRDEALDDSRLFPDGSMALSFALKVGQAAVLNQAFIRTMLVRGDPATA